MKDGEVVELLRIANGYLPRIRLEYDRINEEINSVKAKLNSSKAELNNIARTYQQFVDRNIALKRREDELQHSVNKLEAKESELQKTISRLEQRLSAFENNVSTTNLNPEVKQEDIYLNE
jgi:chromosome segregation ATPase